MSVHDNLRFHCFNHTHGLPHPPGKIKPIMAKNSNKSNKGSGRSRARAAPAGRRARHDARRANADKRLVRSGWMQHVRWPAACPSSRGLSVGLCEGGLRETHRHARESRCCCDQGKTTQPSPLLPPPACEGEICETHRPGPRTPNPGGVCTGCGP